jgi:hypothetical protein
MVTTVAATLVVATAMRETAAGCLRRRLFIRAVRASIGGLPPRRQGPARFCAPW